MMGTAAVKLVGFLVSGGTVHRNQKGYRGFETNEIRYFVCFLMCSKIIRTTYMRQNLQLEVLSREIIKYVNMIFAQYKVKM